MVLPRCASSGRLTAHTKTFSNDAPVQLPRRRGTIQENPENSTVPKMQTVYGDPRMRIAARHIRRGLNPEGRGQCAQLAWAARGHQQAL
jgi:hypothetical protein